MSYINQSQIKKDISEYLDEEEYLVSIGIFKKVPTTSWLLLTKGMAWIFAPIFYVGVTNKQLIIMPESRYTRGEGVVFAGFDEVGFYNDPLSNTIMDIQKIYDGAPLKLRFKSGYQFEGMDQFDFIAAVKQGMSASSDLQE